MKKKKATKSQKERMSDSDKESYPMIGKNVYLDLEFWGQSPSLLETFTNYALNSGWSSAEIASVRKCLLGKTFEAQMDILEHYCLPLLKNPENILLEDVQFLLAHLHLESHYLNFKALESWDEYDWSNYQSLKTKATSCIIRVFAIFNDGVEEEDKYIVTSPPHLFFESREEAEKSSHENTLVYEMWIKKEQYGR